MWLVGSAALGDFRPGRSDLDIQAVAAEVVAETSAASSRPCRTRRCPCPARGLEFVLYAAPDLHRVDGAAFQLDLNTGAGMARHVALRAQLARVD